MKRVANFGSEVYLVNTGWTGGGYGVGKRFDIRDTRSIVRAIQSGSLRDAPRRHIRSLNLDIPLSAPGVDPALLDPRNTWSDPNAYDQAQAALTAKFAANFAQFDVDRRIIDAGPRST